MIGELVYAVDNYEERVIMEHELLQVVLCTDLHKFKMYRLVAPGTNLHNTAYYHSVDMITAWQKAFVKIYGYLLH